MAVMVPADDMRLARVGQDQAAPRSSKAGFFDRMTGVVGVNGLFFFAACFSILAGLFFWAGITPGWIAMALWAALALVGGCVGVARRRVQRP